ncbi:MAG: hypothetical protein AABX73_00295 [Nanoarchaeota archaeon]
MKIITKWVSWSRPTKIGIILGVLGVLLAVVFWVLPWSNVVEFFSPNYDVEVYVVKTYWEPLSNVGLFIPQNNNRIFLSYNNGQRLLNTMAFYENQEANRMDKYVMTNIAGKGCDTCFYYFVMIRNFGKDYEGKIELDMGSTTLNVETMKEKEPGINVEIGGFEGDRKVLITFDKLIKQSGLLPIAQLRVNNMENIKIDSCKIKGKGKCTVYNGDHRIVIIPDNIDKIIFEDYGLVWLPNISDSSNYFLFNKDMKSFEQQPTHLLKT